MDHSRLIGIDGKLPWHIPEDLKRFSALTKGHTVLMGRRTYESLPPKYRPLPDRTNVVVSKHWKTSPDNRVEVVRDLVGYLRACREHRIRLHSNILWIIGGAQIYQATIDEWDELYLTIIQEHGDLVSLGDVPCGAAFFPAFEDKFEETGREEFPDAGVPHVFVRYRRK